MSELIANRYRLEDRLGIGGMSTVHLAYDTRLERHVAVKLLAEHLAEDPTFVSRFRREALAAARLVHPNVVQVFDSGLDESSGRHYIVMERVIGRSCAEMLRDERKLDPQTAVEIVTQACQGLDYAHRHGVVHRDVKPGNLLRSDDGVVKLADFGIAKATEQSSITQVGSVLGTASYLAPEQARGEEATPATDLYSLGVVAYQLISGRLPYEGSSLSELTLRQQRELPPRLDKLEPEAGDPLARAIAIALAIEPERRYSSAAEMARALRGALRGVAPQGADPYVDTGTHVEATRVLPIEPATEIRPLEFDEPTGARREPVATVQWDAPRPTGRRGQRSLTGLLIVLLLIGAAGGGALIAADRLANEPELRSVVADNVRDAVDQLKSLVEDNTQ